ncbi:MAG: DUF2069 domain-containing protein [Xanthomonadales bacterium]|nr:DUF2069 domain-containing protein [Xanthomonadales bacterium]
MTMQAKITSIIYLLLLILQPIWLWLLPSPVGYQSAWLAGIFALPLLFPLLGILKGSLRKAIIGAYITTPHFMFAISEAWTLPDGRWLAITQIGLITYYWVLLIQRGRRRKAERAK